MLRRKRAEGDRRVGIDDDAIWRGEVPDHLVIMTAAERARVDAARALQARRRTLVELFGEPVGSVAASDPTVRHQRRGDSIRQNDMVDQRRSAGCREEIQVTILGHPTDAVGLIADRDLLGVLRRLEIDPGSEERGARQIAWNARLRTTPWSRRSARLRLYGSPSANVTVITLTPVRSRRVGVRRFLNAGLGSLYVLRDSVEQGLQSGRT